MPGKAINYQFKILIALAIIMVVSGHVGNPTLSFNGLFRYDYFHMPLFMFISGYFFSSIATIQSEFIKQSKKLLLPLIGWNIFYGIIVTFLRHMEPFNFTMGQDLSLYSLFWRSFTIGDAFALNVASRFLFTLFLVKLLYVLIRKITYSVCRMPNIEHVLIALFLIIGMAGLSIAKSGYQFELKIQLSRVFYLVFWYAAGFYYKMVLEKLDILSNIKYFLIILTLQLTLVILVEGKNVAVVYSSKYMASSLLIFLLAFSGIAFWLRVSRLLVPHLSDNKTINYIANHTFDIMMHHGFFLKIFVGMMFVFSSIIDFDFFQNFDLRKYKGQIWYSPLPRNGLFFTHIYLCVGVILPCIFAFYFSQLKNQMNNIFKKWKF